MYSARPYTPLYEMPKSPISTDGPRAGDNRRDSEVIVLFY